MAKKKNKLMRRLPLVGILIILMTGVCFFMYPIVSNWITEHAAYITIRKYDEAIQKLDDKEIKELAARADEYNAALAGNQQKKISSFSYEEILSVSDALGYIDIPKLGAYYPIFHGLSDSVLQKGIGHMEGSSLPVGGPSTHAVLAGHTGLPGSKLFTDLDTITEGDIFYIHVLDRVLRYRVDNIVVVLPNDNKHIEIEKDKDYVTLVTCTPYGINDHRLLVRGIRAPDQQKSEPVQEQSGQQDSTQTQSSHITHDNTGSSPSLYTASVQQVLPVRTIVWYIATGVIILVLVGAIMILVFPSIKKRKKSKKQPSEKEDCDDKANSGQGPSDLED